MARGLNKVMLIGWVGQAPELRHTASGRPVASFSLASSHSWETADGERQDETEWFTIVAWGSLAETCRAQLAPGRQIFVEGRLKNRHWEDSHGQRHSATEVVASELALLGGPSPAAVVQRSDETISDYGV